MAPTAIEGRRFLGIDDAPFTFHDASCLAVGVATRGASLVEGILTTRLTVDGRDATDRILEMIRGSRHGHVAAVLLDGITMAGFNVVDGQQLSQKLERPVIGLVRRQSNPASARSAMEARFDDWEERWALFSAHPPRPVPLAGGRLWGSWWGIDDAAVPKLVAAATQEGNWPECLRLAHMIGQAVIQGESRNKA